MKRVVCVLLIIIILGIVYYLYYCQERIEGLALPMSAYTNPQPGQTLRDPAHLSANIYRVTNTILTAANIFNDKMDTLPLPAKIKDEYNEWIEKGFISPIKDQMLCGGCWAFATTASLADRLTIATNGQWYPPFGLSEQILISCGGEMGMDFYQGCEGGIPHFSIDALTKDGVPADSTCLDCGGLPGGEPRGTNGETKRDGGVVNPNNANTCVSGGNVYAGTNYTWWQTGCDGNTSCSLSAASTCPCAGVTAQMKSVEDKTNTPFDIKYKTVGEAHNYTAHGKNNELHTVDLWPDMSKEVIAANVDRMKKAIYYEGPITIGYRVTQDFYTFWPTSAVNNYYKYDGRSPMAGGHAVVIVGWKKMKDGTPVWIVKNSWGANGGYGFPAGPKVKDPHTGKTVIKYMGGFWNHIMGINDSFVESNAVGAHPDLTNPVISKYLLNGGKDIPKEWNKTMTLRDVYLQTAGVKPPPVKPPVKPHVKPPPPPPQEEEPGYTPVIITSDKFVVVNLTPDNISPQALQEFFSHPDNLYMVGSNDVEPITQIIPFLPVKKTLSQDDVKELVKNLTDNVIGYIVFAAKGDANNYYYIDGNPADWNTLFTKKFAKRAATMKKFVNDIYSKFEGLRLQAPVVQLSKKTETFRYI